MSHSPDCDYCNKILDILSDNKFLWPGVIARKVATNPSTIQRHVQDLMEKGLVKEKLYAGVKLYGKKNAAKKKAHLTVVR